MVESPKSTAIGDLNQNDDDSVGMESALKVGDNVFVRPESEIGRIELIEVSRRGMVFHVKMYNGGEEVKKYGNQLCYTDEVPIINNSTVSNEYRRTRVMAPSNTTNLSSQPAQTTVAILSEDTYFANSSRNRQNKSRKRKGQNMENRVTRVRRIEEINSTFPPIIVTCIPR